MASYNELLKQIESLTRQAEEVRKTEFESVLAGIKETMREHGITIADLRSEKKPARSRPPKKGSSGSKVAPKYRDSASGQTWSGRGRTPRWLADAEAGGAKRESFAV